MAKREVGFSNIYCSVGNAYCNLEDLVVKSRMSTFYHILVLSIMRPSFNYLALVFE